MAMLDSYCAYQRVFALTFTANGEHLVSGGREGVQVWRLEDAKEVASMLTATDDIVLSVAASKDGRFIAAGSYQGEVWTWDTTSSYKQVFASGKRNASNIFDLDFSPRDSSRLVFADAQGASVWNTSTRKEVQALPHDRLVVRAAKYSLHGDRIATATDESIRVWDGINGRLLVDIKGQVNPWHGLLWFNNHLFIITNLGSKIKQFDASTGSTVWEWSVPSSNHSCIALPHHGKFVAYSTGDDITFWDTSTHARVHLISQSGHATAFSPDDQLLAVIAPEGELVIRRPFFVTVAFYYLPVVYQDPEIYIDSVALNAWKRNHLIDAEALLTAAISSSNDTTHHVLASRALVRARLGKWDAALMDAEKSIEIQSSVIGGIAKCVALVGKGEMQRGCPICDIPSHSISSDVAIHLLIKAVALFMLGKREDAISRVDHLITNMFSDSTFYAVQAYMLLLLGNLNMDNDYCEPAIQSFEDARVKLGDCTGPPLSIVSLVSGWNFDNLATTIQLRLCETLFQVGQVKKAGKSVLRMLDLGINMSEPIGAWIVDFMQRCLSTSEDDDTSLGLLGEWARFKLATLSWERVLAAAARFTLSRFTIYQVICERLNETGHVAEAISCLNQMCKELREIEDKQAYWVRDFKSRCHPILLDLGDIAMNAGKYDEAILHYTTVLSLDPTTPQDMLERRSKAYAGKEEWHNALYDANEVIKLDPSSPLGYERKYAALHGTKRHVDAIHAFETMLLKMSESDDSEIRAQWQCYISPEKTKETIRTTIDDTLRDSPLVLIHTGSGRLHDRAGQGSAFEATPAFTELVSSVTTHIDNARIKQEVSAYFQYVTLSHKWEADEPLFEPVIRIVVYDLEASPTHEKLQMFCKIVREAGFNWAWSDTCCINKGDHFVLQEALVSMFKWYERSAMTLIFLRGVGRLALRGALTRSIWNMRAWTLQEYHASKVVQIYTEDWTPYLGLTIYNHKESPEIILEMEEVTRISAGGLMALRPGLDDIREKLRLASTRQTTRVEDAAYSLLGIFSMSMPITYGEGDQALGRLLAQLLTSSGDTSILAWTGISGSFNSCLPAAITVFSQLSTTHIPAIPDSDIRTMTAALRSLNVTSATKLYDRVNGLSVPLFVGQRMKLPCLAFKLGPISVSQHGQGRAFRSKTNALGVVEIRADEDISQLGSLYLIHPWIDFLLDRRPVGSVTPTITEENTGEQTSLLGELVPTNVASPSRMARFMSRIGRPFGGRSDASTSSLRSPSTVSLTDKRARVLQFLARLRCPFGALLLTPTRLNVKEYRRVAAESLITVQVEEITPAILDKLIRGAGVLDVL